MTKLEGYKAAALRDGMSLEEWERGLVKIKLSGALPSFSHEEIEPGCEEDFIQRQMRIKRATDFASATCPQFNKWMETKLRKRLVKN